MSQFMDIEEKLKKLEREQQRLEAERVELEQQLEQQKVLDQKLESLYEQSGFKSPKSLVLALMQKYKLSPSVLVDSFQVRKRTKITAQIRDDIRDAVQGGASKNAVSKQYELSYNVVTKIMEGYYDHLKV